MSNADNVVVGITGKVYVGATTVTAPTSSTSVLPVGFKDLGYISTDGVDFTPDKSTNEIRAWQDSALLRSNATEGKMTYSFTLLETTKDVLELYFGSPMVNGKIAYNPVNTGGKKSFVIDVVDGAKLIRHYLPSAEVTSIQDQKIQNNDALAYGVTITAYVKDGRSADIYYSEFEV